MPARWNKWSDLPQIGYVPPKPDADLIRLLESLLSKAESGELGGIAYIGYSTDRNIEYGVVGAEMYGQNLRTYALLHWLADRTMKRWDEKYDK